MQTASFKDVCALFVKKQKGKKMVPQGFRSFWILPVEVDGSWFDFLLWLLESNRFLNVGQTLQKKKNLSISFCSSSPNTSTILFFFFFFKLFVLLIYFVLPSNIVQIHQRHRQHPQGRSIMTAIQVTMHAGKYGGESKKKKVSC